MQPVVRGAGIAGAIILGTKTLLARPTDGHVPRYREKMRKAEQDRKVEETRRKIVSIVEQTGLCYCIREKTIIISDSKTGEELSSIVFRQ